MRTEHSCAEGAIFRGGWENGVIKVGADIMPVLDEERRWGEVTVNEKP